MMIKLNLISDREKEKRDLEEKIGSILRLGASIIFALLLLSVVLFSAQVVLGIYFKSAQEELKAQSGKSLQEIQEAENLLKDVNLASKKISKTAREVPYWSKVLVRISQICPDGVKINTIHAEKEHLRIGGFSKTREDFLQFQEKLKDESFENLVSPVSNLVSPVNFNFTVEVDLDKDYLNQS